MVKYNIGSYLYSYRNKKSTFNAEFTNKKIKINILLLTFQLHLVNFNS